MVMRVTEEYLRKKRSRQKFMCRYNTVMCFSAGPPMLLLPGLTKKLLKWPYDDPVMTGIYGSIVTSVGVLSAASLLDESKLDGITPVFLTQILYKSLACGMIAVHRRREGPSSWGLTFLFWFFALYIVLLAWAIPWKELAGNAEAG